MVVRTAAAMVDASVGRLVYRLVVERALQTVELMVSSKELVLDEQMAVTLVDLLAYAKVYK